MKKRLPILILALCLLITAAPTGAAAADTLTADIPIYLSVEGATGIDVNVRLNPDYVSGAKVVSVSDSLSDAVIVDNVDGAKLKVAIASSAAFDNSGLLCTVRLTLKKQAGELTELCKVMQVKVNEKITFQADNAILLDGVESGATYTDPVTVGFNEGTATLNGKAFVSGSTVSENGEYVLSITDLNGKVRTVEFTIASGSVLGDVDGSGLVDSNDAIYLLRYTLDSAKYPINQDGDMNGDGSVNSDDAIYLLRFTLSPDRYPLK